MAKAPKKTKVTGQVLPPDFELMDTIYENDIAPASSAQKRAMKDQSDAWKEAKGEAHVHAGGAKTAYKVLRMEDADRDAWLRSFNGVLSHRGVGISADLVDLAGGEDAGTRSVVPIVDAPRVEVSVLN